MQPLTDQERHELIGCLRNRWQQDVPALCDKAANEIERLDKIANHLAAQVAGPHGIVADEIKAAEEHLCSR